MNDDQISQVAMGVPPDFAAYYFASVLRQGLRTRGISYRSAKGTAIVRQDWM